MSEAPLARLLPVLGTVVFERYPEGQLAALSDESASIAGNLKAGDRVVALGAHLLHEGELVRVAADQVAVPAEAVNRVARQ